MRGTGSRWRRIRRHAGVVAASATIAMSTLVGLSASAASADDGGRVRSVRVMDDCDPVTFNAAVGDGTCVRPEAGTPFDDFIAEVAEQGSADDWAYSTDHLTVRPGDVINVSVRGGETHSFTRVSQFGGGIVGILNQLSGNSTPCPECAGPGPDANGDFAPPGTPPDFPEAGFVAPGHPLTVDANSLTMGTNRFQCIIHPWMRAVVTKRG